MWTPQPGPQAWALSADWCDELFFGGERGGGKSDFQLGYQEDAALRYEGKSAGLMFRKTYAELEELQGRACEIFPGEGAIYKTQPSEKYPYSNCWYWPNGATCKMRYIENERDYGRYHGHQYSHISPDEVTEHPTPDGILKMISTLRNAYGVPCSMRLTGNPGGVGHGWVKERYITPAPPKTPFVDPDSGFTRMFIPSRTTDNQILLRADPNYIQRIKAATGGNKALRKAWLEGDWDIVAGAFFDCWDKRRHVVRPFTLPGQWLSFRCGDWGSARPFAFYWIAVADNDYRVGDLILPRGCLVVYREWYGMARNASGAPLYNTGLKLTAEAVGQGIKERDRGDNISYGVLDPAAFSQDGGPSIAERMGWGLKFRRADNARVSQQGHLGGWDMLRNRLIGEAEHRPMIVFFNDCVDIIRTLPLLQHDKDRLEDVDTDNEDHGPDAIRYGCMSRPWIPAKQGQVEDIKDFRSVPVAKLFGDTAKREKRI